MNSTKNLIIGGGLSGLGAAYHLKNEGHPDWLMFERSERVGGLCKSVKYDGGFTFDHAIHILYSSDPYASGLIKDLLSGNMAVKGRESWVYSSGEYTPYPWQANTFGLPVNIVKECLMGVIKATYEKEGCPGPANFGEWCYATFGEGLARHFMIPYNSKLWAINPKKMTDAWIKDRVMTPSLDEVIEGSLHRQEKDFGPNKVFWYPERGGIEALPIGFLPHLDREKIIYNTEVVKVLWKEKKVVSKDACEWSYDKLITSMPLPVLAGHMGPEIPPDLKKAAGNLEHNTVYAVNLAVKRDELSPYHWVYFPEEKYTLHRISFPKNFSTSMVPDGWNSITVEVSASKYRRVPTGDELINTVIDDLKNADVINNGDTIEVKSVLTLNPAYIIYNHTHPQDVNMLHQFLNENEIFPCGRFGDWEYLNMDHSILSGKRAAEKVLEK